MHLLPDGRDMTTGGEFRVDCGAVYVDVSIDEAGKNDAPLQIDRARVLAAQGFGISILACGDDSIITDCDCLDDGALGIHRHDLSVR